MIVSKTNQQLKKVRKLLSSASERRKSGLFVVEGSRLFSETPEELVEAVYVSEDYRKDIPDRGLSEALLKKTEAVEKDLFRSLSDTVNPQGILAVVRQPLWRESFEKFLEGPTDGKVLMLDGLRDPGNLGTILRTAEAAGVRFVIMSPDCVDLYNPKVIRSTMGSIFRVPALTADLETVISRLRSKGRNIYGTSLSAVKSYREADLSDAGIVIGSEAEGVSEKVLSCVTDTIKIPMQGQVESLNAAVSAAILMFC